MINEGIDEDDETAQALAQLQDFVHGTNVDNDSIVPSGQRACPICGQIMVVDEYMGIKIDACQQHGVWFDRGELSTVVALLKAENGSSRIRINEMLKRARRDGKVSAMVFGGWSLLMD